MKRRIFSLLLVLLLLVSACPMAIAAGLPADCSAQEWEVLKLVNKERLAESLAPLSTFAALQTVSDVRAQELTAKFSHTRPDGTSCFTAYNVPYSSAGENIAAGYPDAAAVMDGWMHSEGHRANILTGYFSHVGVGYLTTNSGYGSYWSQNFIGSCTESDLRVVKQKDLYILQAGQTPEDLGLALSQTCENHGVTYLPVIDEMCSGFDPADTQQQTVTITAGSLHTTVQVRVSPFVDVSGSRFYAVPVLWAVDNRITNGMDATHFAPEANCTRAQVVTFLWRAAGCPKPTATTSVFTDISPKAFSYQAILWAAENGITTGIDATHFVPDAVVSRAQFVTFLYRLNGKPAPSGSNPFADVPARAYFYDAVLWAAETGVTTGMDATHFAPNDGCTRGQVVSFLYRSFSEDSK